MRLDRLVRVDGLVGEGDANVAVPGDDLRDVRRQPVQDCVGDEETEVVWREPERIAGDLVGEPGVIECGSEYFTDDAGADRAVLMAVAALEQHRRRRRPDAFPAVVRGDERDRPGRAADAADDQRPTAMARRRIPRRRRSSAKYFLRTPPYVGFAAAGRVLRRSTACRQWVLWRSDRWE